MDSLGLCLPFPQLPPSRVHPIPLLRAGQTFFSPWSSGLSRIRVIGVDRRYVTAVGRLIPPDRLGVGAIATECVPTHPPESI